MKPCNLILQGPPGTGKTHATASEAIRLCGESVPDDRAEVMEAYQRLRNFGRIEFVTFHQSMTYEDFVEGRQPMTGSAESKDDPSTGFRLETVPGIFRRIAKRAERAERAEANRWQSRTSNAIKVPGRQVFIMPIGESANPDEVQLFDEAIRDGDAILGFSDIDWSNNKAPTVRTDQDRVADAISKFMHQRREDLVYWASGSGHNNALAVNEAHEPVARYDRDTDMLYIAGSALRDWFEEQHITLKNLRAWMDMNDVTNPTMRLAPRRDGIRCYAVPASVVGLDYEQKEAMIRVGELKDKQSSSVSTSSDKTLLKFRKQVRQGDIIIVSKGDRLFRAIGVVRGDYRVVPRPEGDYGHRRSVEWIWTDPEGVSVADIYPPGFIQGSIYKLVESQLNIPVLEKFMNSPSEGEARVPVPFVLIIDEINRANISKVLGELITLLEEDKRLGQTNELKVRLPYSGDLFGVPPNLHIVGTMNTADRSIALLDTALRRRFIFREIMPDPTLLSEAAATTGIDLPQLLRAINGRIEYLHDREHQIGHAYFMGCRTTDDIDTVMREKVIPLLTEYFFEDWSRVAAVLGDMKPGDGEISGGFLNRHILSPPPGFEEDEALPRFRWVVRGSNEGFDYRNLLGT